MSVIEPWEDRKLRERTPKHAPTDASIRHRRANIRIALEVFIVLVLSTLLIVIPLTGTPALRRAARTIMICLAVVFLVCGILAFVLRHVSVKRSMPSGEFSITTLTRLFCIRSEYLFTGIVLIGLGCTSFYYGLIIRGSRINTALVVVFSLLFAPLLVIALNIALREWIILREIFRGRYSLQLTALTGCRIVDGGSSEYSSDSYYLFFENASGVRKNRVAVSMREYSLSRPGTAYYLLIVKERIILHFIAADCSPDTELQKRL